MATVFPPVTAVLPVSTNGTTHGMQLSLRPDIRGELMVITPQMAADLLKNRLPNRPISKARIRVMIDDMRSGRWRVNGESLILDGDLRVLDGQHRLMACVESGVDLVCFVVVGVAPDAMPSIDQGRSKVAGDLLHMAGLTQAKELASAARWLWRFEHARMRESTIALRNDALPAYVQVKPALPASLQWGRLVRDLLPQSIASMLYYVTSQKDAGLSKRFFDALAHGDSLSKQAPALVAREKLLRDKSPKNHLGIVVRGALVVLAFNCVRLDRAMPGSFTWKGVTDASVPFPEVV